MKRLTRLGVVAAAVLLVHPSPAANAAEDALHEELITTQIAAQIEAADIDMSSGDSHLSAIEASAVDTFVADTGGQFDESDVEVATVELDDALDVVVAAPKDELVVESLAVETDPDSQEVSAGAESTVTEDALVTGGPGMGIFPGWVHSTQYQIIMKVYRNDNYLGYARVSTKFRDAYNDKGVHLYQYTREIYGQPEPSYPVTGPDKYIHVAKLWISNRLTDATQDGAGQQYANLTEPNAASSVCAQNSGTIGPWGVGITNCSDTEVWLSPTNVGHMRVSMDQGQVTGGGARSIAYVNGYSMKKGRSPANTYYEFITGSSQMTV